MTEGEGDGDIWWDGDRRGGGGELSGDSLPGKRVKWHEKPGLVTFPESFLRGELLRQAGGYVGPARVLKIAAPKAGIFLMVGLSEELSAIALIRSAERLFKDQLADRHMAHQFHSDRSMIANFKLYLPFEASVNGGGSDVDADPQPGQRTFPLHSSGKAGMYG